MNAHPGRRFTKTVHFSVAAPPSQVFPLLCPVREYDWLDGWSCTMIHSVSGVAEAGCVFQTSRPLRGEETWFISRYEPENFAIEFVVFNPGSHVMKLAIVLAAREPGTEVHWTNTFIGLTEAGNAFVEVYGVGHHEAIMSGLARALDHYCRTGLMLKEGGSPVD